MGFWDKVKEGYRAVDDFGNSIRDKVKGALGGYQPEQDAYNLPGYQDRQDRLLGLAGQTDDRQFRDQQQAALDMLMRSARGENSLAMEQARQLNEQNIAQQRSLAAGARPGQSAMAQRLAAQNVGRLNAGVAGQALQANLAERMGALGQLGGLSTQARGQDIDRALGLYGMELQNAGMQQQGAMGYQNARSSMQTPLQTLLNAGGQAGAIWATTRDKAPSDRRVKTDIGPGGGRADAFLESLIPQEYRYKTVKVNTPEAVYAQQRHPTSPAREAVLNKYLRGQEREAVLNEYLDKPLPPRNLGIMAQDLERTPIGAQAVVDTPGGKVVDFGQLGGAQLAALARLHERLKAVEGKR